MSEADENSGQDAAGNLRGRSVPPAPAAGVAPAAGAGAAAGATDGPAVDGPTRAFGRPEPDAGLPDLAAVAQEHAAQVRAGAVAAAPAAAGPTPTDDAGAQPAVAAPGATGAGESVESGPRAAVRRLGAPDASGGRSARVRLASVNPVATMKIAFVINIALFFVWMVAVGILYLALSAMGVFDKVNTTYTELTDPGATSTGFGALEVFSFAGVVGLIGVVLLTILATLGAYIYNACSELVGGVEVTIADD